MLPVTFSLNGQEAKKSSRDFFIIIFIIILIYIFTICTDFPGLPCMRNETVMLQPT